MRLLCVGVILLAVLPTLVASLNRRLEVRGVAAETMCKALNKQHGKTPFKKEKDALDFCDTKYQKKDKYVIEKCKLVAAAWFAETKNGAVDCKVIKTTVQLHVQHVQNVQEEKERIKKEKKEFEEFVQQTADKQLGPLELDCDAGVAAVKQFVKELYPLIMELPKGQQAYETALRNKLGNQNWGVWGNIKSVGQSFNELFTPGQTAGHAMSLAFAASSMLYHLYDQQVVIPANDEEKQVAWFRTWATDVVRVLHEMNYVLTPRDTCNFGPATIPCSEFFDMLIAGKTPKRYLDGNEFIYFGPWVDSASTARFLINSRSDKRAEVFACLMIHVSKNPYAYFKMTPYHAPQEGFDIGFVDNFVIYATKEHSLFLLTEIQNCAQKDWIDDQHHLGFLPAVAPGVYYSEVGGNSMAVALARFAANTIADVCVKDQTKQFVCTAKQFKQSFFTHMESFDPTCPQRNK